MSARNAFIVDLNRCTGCHACETACQIANAVPGDLRWRRVRTFNELHVHGVEVVHLSLACNHCAAAPCMDACPARAVYRDEATGAVLIDQDKCIGCRYCAWACPYGAPRYDRSRSVMAKCDLCVERRRAGREPACVTACPTGALDWGRPPEARLAQSAPGMAEASADPSIHIVALSPSRRAPRQTEPPATPPWRSVANRIVPHITLSREWALAVFTLLASALVGVFTASRLGAPAPGPIPFLGAGAAGLLLSASHLGRKMHAWRAALHADRSWLSREVALFAAFLALATLSLLLGPASTAAGRPPAPQPPPWTALYSALGGATAASALGWVAAALGVAALTAAGRVYRFARIRGAPAFHSAHLLATGLLLGAAWSGAAAPVAALAALKAALYVLRKLNRLKTGLAGPAWATALRLGLLAAGAAAVGRHAPAEVAFALLLFAELIDRAEYYNEMEIPTPESLMLEELGSRPQAVPARHIT